MRGGGHRQEYLCYLPGWSAKRERWLRAREIDKYRSPVLYSVRLTDGVIVFAINDVECGTTSLWPKFSVTANSASRTDVGRCFFDCVPKCVNPSAD